MKYVTCEELSEMIPFKASSIRKMVKSGEIPAYFLGKRKMLFDPEEVNNAIKNNLIKRGESDTLSVTVANTHRR